MSPGSERNETLPPLRKIEIRIRDLGAVYNYLSKQENPVRIEFEDNWDTLTSHDDKIRISHGYVGGNQLIIASTFSEGSNMEFKGTVRGLPEVKIEDLQKHFEDRGFPSEFSDRTQILNEATIQLMLEDSDNYVQHIRHALKFERDEMKYDLELKTSHVNYVESDRKEIYYRVHLEDYNYGKISDKHGFIRQTKYFKELIGALIGSLYQISGTKPSFDSLSFSPISILEQREDPETISIITGEAVRRPIHKPIEELWVGYDIANCTYCGSTYPSEQVSMHRGKIHASDPTCKHCGASNPEIIDDF